MVFILYISYLHLTGFNDKSVREIELALMSFGRGLQEASVALKDCNVEKLVTEIAKLAHDLQTGPGGIVKVVIKELINIFHHHKEITNDFKQFMSYWKQHQLELAGVKAGALTGILLDY
jgi:hypothetical protein